MVDTWDVAQKTQNQKNITKSPYPYFPLPSGDTGKIKHPQPNIMSYQHHCCIQQGLRLALVHPAASINQILLQGRSRGYSNNWAR